MGKMGKKNQVAITDPEVVKVIMHYADSVMSLPNSIEDSLEQSLFTLEDGHPFTYKMFMGYFKKRVSSKLSPKVLRSLKATETLLNELYEQQKELYKRILEFVKEETVDLKQRIVSAITQAIENAVVRAQQTLHHDSPRVTVDYYASPQVILNFLSQGGVEKDLKKEIITNTPKLRFDPNLFLEKALQQKNASLFFNKISTSSGISLRDILEDLEDSLGMR